MSKTTALNSIQESFEELQGCAVADADGIVLAHSGQFDADVACASVALGRVELQALAEELGLGAPKEFFLTTREHSLMVIEQRDAVFVALGAPTEQLAKTSERLRTVVREQLPE